MARVGSYRLNLRWGPWTDIPDLPIIPGDPDTGFQYNPILSISCLIRSIMVGFVIQRCLFNPGIVDLRGKVISKWTKDFPIQLIAFSEVLFKITTQDYATIDPTLPLGTHFPSGSTLWILPLFNIWCNWMDSGHEPPEAVATPEIAAMSREWNRSPDKRQKAGKGDGKDLSEEPESGSSSSGGPNPNILVADPLVVVPNPPNNWACLCGSRNSLAVHTCGACGGPRHGPVIPANPSPK
jgi:hypothetical protein